MCVYCMLLCITASVAFCCVRQPTFDMAYEIGAELNIRNVQNLTPLTLAAKLARIQMFFHILKIEREIYWQIGNNPATTAIIAYARTAAHELIILYYRIECASKKKKKTIANDNNLFIGIFFSERNVMTFRYAPNRTTSYLQLLRK